MVQPGKNFDYSRSVPVLLSEVDVSERSFVTLTHSILVYSTPILDSPGNPLVSECSVPESERSALDMIPSVVVSLRHVPEIESDVGQTEME